MKLKLLLLALLPIMAFAQSFTVNKDTAIGYILVSNGAEQLHVKVINNGTTTIAPTWKMASTNFSGLTDWSVSQICDNNQCYTSGFASNHTMLSLAPGDTADFKVEALWGAAPTNALGEVVISFTLGFSSKTVVFQFNKNLIGVGINKLNNKNYNFSFYPNPARNFLKINSTYSNETIVKVYNLAGQVVYSDKTTIDANTTVPVATLPKGMYFLQINNTENKQLFNKLFVKD